MHERTGVAAGQAPECPTDWWDFRYNRGVSRKLLFFQLLIVAALAATHFVALAFSLYWYFPWFDVITHFLGGMWAGVFLLWSCAQARSAPHLLFVVGGTIAIGVMWEVFEVVAGIPMESNYAFDTSIDLLMDVLGSVFAFGIARRISS
jgi:hypothetical protein